MAWPDLLSQPDLGVRFYLWVSGIPYMFLDGPTPVDASGTPWAALTSSGHTVGLLPHTLDAGDIQDIGPQVSRSTSDVSPASMSIRLQDDAQSSLLALFAREKATGNGANLAGSFGYDGSSPPTSMSVDSTSGWASSGYVYFGRETIYYGALTATSFTTLTRDLFSSGDTDQTYVANDSKVSNSPRVVTDYPRVWHGRTVHLYAFLVDANGRALDSGFGSSVNTWEIWRGVIRGNPRPADDWFSWTLDTASIESVLSTDVGPTEIKGTLLRVASGLASNKAGTPDQPWAESEPVYWIAPGSNRIAITVRRFTGAGYVNGTIDKEVSWTLPEEGVSTGTIRSAFTLNSSVATAATRVGIETLFETVNTAINAEFGGLSPYLGVGLNNKWRFSLLNDGTNVYSILIEADGPDSVLPLLGFSGMGTIQQWINIDGSTFGNVKITAANGQAAVYIRPTATSIPFFYADSEGINTGPPPASGYVSIDDREVVHYESITALSGDYEGLYTLDHVTRGAMGTEPVTYIVPIDGAGDETGLRFGLGWEQTDILDVVLQLAISTGEGHHGSYDVLPSSVGAAIPPGHFDAAQMVAVLEGLPPQLRRVSYFQAKPERLSEMAAQWLQPLGLFLVGGTDGSYQVRIARIQGHLESAAATALDTSTITLDGLARWEGGSDRIINHLSVKPRWDNARSEPRDVTVHVFDDDSIQQYGESGTLDWTLRGYDLGTVDAVPVLHLWAQGIFRRFARPYDVFRVSTGRRGWLLSPGSSIAITMPGIPTSTGVRGMSSVPATVLQTSKLYTGESPGAEVLCIVEPVVRRSTYAPCASVTAYNAATPSITLGSTYAAIEADHFAASDVIWVYEFAGDVASRVQRTVVSKAGAVLALDSALGFTPTAATLVTGADYAAVQATQRAHAHVADASSPPVLSATDTTAFKYVA